MRNLTLFLFLLFAFKTTNASHIVGGEMFYEYLGNNQYHITLKLYRDCSPSSNSYPNPLHLAIYQANDITQLIQIDIPFPGAITLPNDANNPCLIVPPNICVQEAIYDTIVTLPPIPGGYNIVYQVCCRNYSIDNIPSDLTSFGASYLSTIPDSSMGINNEAYFNEFPPTVICANYPFTFDHSATDPDGDSLVYGLCVLFDNDGSAQPDPPLPPPFPIITNYNVPYNYLNPMGGDPALSIDPATGEVTITPNTIGQFVVGICVTEYRNGVFLCEHRRDFQFNVA